ncbi:exported protein of unknown function [Ralstonia solanacearum CFBP2957]|nr:exported protein of unknown function [Ralstonia solanacearum CFBP2957]
MRKGKTRLRARFFMPRRRGVSAAAARHRMGLASAVAPRKTGSLPCANALNLALSPSDTALPHRPRLSNWYGKAWGFSGRMPDAPAVMQIK